MKAELILDAKAKLGEGAIWNHQSQKLYWIDIEGKLLHIFDPFTKEQRKIATGARIGTVVPATEGGAIVALQNGIHHLDFLNEQLTLLTNPLARKENIRFNDGKCDPLGRFWVGSMALDEKPQAASLYCLDLNGTVREMLDGVTISNGITWSEDKQSMYYIDTPTRRISAFDYDLETGAISNRRTVVSVPTEMGFPDGMSIDAEGKLWVAHFGGACVGRWDPENGHLLQKIAVPALNVTSCAFGGENFETLYITTASVGLSDEKKAAYPLSGGLFAVQAGMKGVPANFYRGTIRPGM